MALSGDVINDELPSPNGEIPLPEWTVLGEGSLADMSDESRTSFRTRAMPTPLHVAIDPQRLSDARRYEGPVMIIACRFTSDAVTEWIATKERGIEELAAIRDVTVVDLSTGHGPQPTKPTQLTTETLAAAELARGT